MKKIILTLIFCLFTAPAVAGHPIASAQFTDSGVIHVTLNDGREFDVPDNPANSHRQQIAKWVAQGNTVAPAAPAPEPTRLEKIRSDPSYPSPQEFLEAQMHCRYDLDCSALDALSSRIKLLEDQYP